METHLMMIKSSSTFTECHLPKTICTPKYHLISCGRPDLSSRNRWCRCDARNNYVFYHGHPDEQGCSNSLTTKCVKYIPCPDSKARSIRGDYKKCLEDCQIGEYRPHDSDDCLKTTDIPDMSTKNMGVYTTLQPDFTTQGKDDSTPGRDIESNVSIGILVGILVGIILIVVFGLLAYIIEYDKTHAWPGAILLIWVGVMTLSVTALVNNTTDHYTCHRDTSTLTCDYDLPDHWNIPDGITEIYITNYNFSTITERSPKFKYAKWKIVKTLDITAELPSYFNLDNNDFEDLPHLQRFGIHSTDYLYTALSAFVGLNDLSYLDFSGCIRLKSKYLFDALANKNNSFHLDYLILDGVASKNDVVILDDVFVNMLGDRNVLHLSIRSTQIFLPHDVQYESSLDLVSLNVFDSIITKQLRKIHFNATKVLKNLKYVNSSRATFGNNGMFVDKAAVCYETILSIETIDFSHICNTPINITNVVDASCFSRLKHVYMHSNTIVRYTPTIVYYPPYMETLDLSWNGMELISPTALNKFAMLIILDLSNNHLFKMEHNSEFENLFIGLNTLETIYLQSNSLSFLPTSLFKANSELKTHVLSDNKLKSIDFNINHLHKLQLLDLQGNKIVYLESFQTLNLQNYLTLSKRAGNNSFHLDLKNNIFECSCEHIEFLMWIYIEIQPMYNATYSCSLESNIVNIDSKSLEKTSYLCYKTSIIVGWVASILMTVIISGLTLFVCNRKRRKKQKQTITNRFLNQLIKGQCDEKYLVFVSLSSDDCQFSNNDIEPALKYHMSEQYEIPERLIVTGDTTFKVGFPILNEIMRCIRASCVVICLVSQSYCDSQWCQTELREAVEQGKPMILLFLENNRKTKHA